MTKWLKQKKILTIGDIGSIGRKLSKYCIDNGVFSLVRVFEQKESEMFNLQHELVSYTNIGSVQFLSTIDVLTGTNKGWL